MASELDPRSEEQRSHNDEGLLEVARERFAQAQEASSHWRDSAREDLRFRAGEQWPDEIKAERDRDDRPCLTINELPKFIHQVTNDQKLSRPGLKASAVESDEDVDIADVYQGMMRSIEVESGADMAIDTAFSNAVTIGRGYYRILTDYVDEMSFDQKIMIKRIRNSFSVYTDPSAQEMDLSDMRWAFVVERMSRNEFKLRYPNIDPQKMDEYAALGDTWIEREQVRIAEYFWIEDKATRIYDLMGDVKGVLEEDMPPGLDLAQFRSRRTLVPVVQWTKITGYDVLERREWPGRWIPIIPVFGDEIDIEGRIDHHGIVRNAKDPQRNKNYWATAATEMIALAPKAPYIGVEGQFEGYERSWAESNRRNVAYLEYRDVSLRGGGNAPPPQRQIFEPPVAAITQERLISSQDLNSTTGIYKAALGDESNEKSGKALQARQQESDVSNFHFGDNLRVARRHEGRILIDLIPRIYRPGRVVRIIGEDEAEKVVKLGEPSVDSRTKKEVFYDLDKGKYDVVATVGPNYQTKRQQAADFMNSIISAAPQLMEIAGDLIVKAQDGPGAQEIAERIRRTIPPEIIGEDGEVDEQQLQAMIPQLKQQLQALNEYAKELEAKAAELEQQVETKDREHDLKERELVLKAEIEGRELDLKEEELEIKRMEAAARVGD